MKLFYSILLGALVLLTSCTTQVRKNYLLLIDNSTSIDAEVWAKYLQAIENSVLVHMGPQDRLTVMMIDECTLTKAERIYQLDLASKVFSRTSDGMNLAADSAKARLRRYVMDTVLIEFRTTIAAKRAERERCGAYTDILNVLRESMPLLINSKNFEGDGDKALNAASGKESFRYENCILIFSDMVNENRDKTYDFSEMGKWKAEKVMQKFESLRDSEHVPDLAGVKVIVYGATASKKAGRYANQQVENVRDFWELYFKSAGAEVLAYAFDTDQEIREYVSKVE